MIKALAAAIVAWMVAMPLVAVHFEQFNPWAIPASIAASPLVFLSLVAGVLKVVLTAFLPEASELWAQLALYPVKWMLGVVEWFAARPGADVPLPKPPLPMVGFAYLTMSLWLVHWPTPGLRWAMRTPLAAACLLLFIVPFTTAASLAEQPLRATVLAVGAGQCVVVETPGGRVAMIDVGSTSLGDPVEKCVAPFLRSRGYTRVDLLLLSHANWDHYGGAADLTQRYGVGEVIVGEHFGRDAEAFASGRRLLDDLVHLDRPPRTVRVGDVVPLGRQTSLRVLWPPADAADLSSNDASLVVKLEHAGRSILFSGDIQDDGMRRLLMAAEADGSLLKADVLIAPHHGSSEQVTERFVEAVAPEWIISSNGRVLSQKQRNFAQLTGGRPLLRTHETGAVTVSVDEAGGMEVESFLGSRPRSLSYSE
jgi:competence protein ComEC